MNIIKAIKIKKEDWSRLSKLAALKQLTTAKPIPLHDIISDLMKYKEKLEYYSNKDICKLKVVTE